jgi:hypothetical protein
MNISVTGNLPPEELEHRAADQRRRLHNSVSELRSSLTDLKDSVEENVRERLDVNRFARKHMWQLAAGASVLALMAGHGFARMFTRR